jgi:hypothetical protein
MRRTSWRDAIPIAGALCPAASPEERHPGSKALVWPNVEDVYLDQERQMAAILARD